MTLWDKGGELDERVARFTVQNDYVLDHKLLPYDCLASEAHAEMLQRKGLLSAAELGALREGLAEIRRLGEQGRFEIRPEDEDVHTAIERFLTARCGEAGRKIHTARSRNDQVLTALRLYEKKALADIREAMVSYGEALGAVIEADGQTPLPGYTHMRKAMPTTVGAWLGSFVASSEDDRQLLEAVAARIDQSPLGTAAGFGVPLLDIDRQGTARAMGFARVMDNPLYAQLSRGKFEATIIHLCSQLGFDLNRLATDLTLFSMPEFGFVSLPEALCTGSSIMPQKQNPDVLELVRAKYHTTLGAELAVQSLIGNLVSGYNRDVQLTKAPLFSSIDDTLESLEVMAVVLRGLRIDDERCRAALTGELYATEQAYRLVQAGVPFRDAYRQVAARLRAAGSSKGEPETEG